MARLTREKDQWKCRIAGGCPVEEWIDNHGIIVDESNDYFCEDCPFEKYINKLAEYEDKYEGEKIL